MELFPRLGEFDEQKEWKGPIVSNAFLIFINSRRCLECNHPSF